MPVLSGTLLQPRSAEDCRILKDVVVNIGEDGRIVDVSSGRTGASEIVGGEGCWILPGFIDAHLHLPQWDRRGIDGLSLFDWQEKIGYPAEARFADATLAAKLMDRFVADLISFGTTTIAAFGSAFAAEVDQTFSIFARRGLRAIYGMMLSDVGVPPALTQDPDTALDQSRELAAKWEGAERGRLRYAFSPRASIRCSEKMMRGAAALAGMLKCYLQTHMAESIEEVESAHRQFSEYVDEVDLFSDMGLLTPRTLLAHGVFANAQQRRQVAQAGTALVHCPTANLFRESGLMDYAAHRSAGIRIALGSSIAGGPEPFMPAVASEAIQSAKAVKVHTLPRHALRVPAPAEAWWLMTRGAAEALGLSDRVGSIEVGFEADCLVVRPEPWIDDLPEQQQISALLYTIRPRQIEYVFIAGRRVGPAN